LRENRRGEGWPRDAPSSYSDTCNNREESIGRVLKDSVWRDRGRGRGEGALGPGHGEADESAARKVTRGVRVAYGK
jgi:hypothetical protein